MSVEKVGICGQWQLLVALFTDVTNLKELRQSVIDGQLDVALISPSVVRLLQCLKTKLDLWAQAVIWHAHLCIRNLCGKINLPPPSTLQLQMNVSPASTFTTLLIDNCQWPVFVEFQTGDVSDVWWWNMYIIQTSVLSQQWSLNNCLTLMTVFYSHISQDHFPVPHLSFSINNRGKLYRLHVDCPAHNSNTLLLLRS